MKLGWLKYDSPVLTSNYLHLTNITEINITTFYIIIHITLHYVINIIPYNIMLYYKYYSMQYNIVLLILFQTTKVWYAIARNCSFQEPRENEFVAKVLRKRLDCKLAACRNRLSCFATGNFSLKSWESLLKDTSENPSIKRSGHFARQWPN